MRQNKKTLFSYFLPNQDFILLYLYLKKKKLKDLEDGLHLLYSHQ